MFVLALKKFFDVDFLSYTLFFQDFDEQDLLQGNKFSMRMKLLW